MRWIGIVSAVILMLPACSGDRGIGFDYYEVKPGQSEQSEDVEIQWRDLEPIPRHLVNGAKTANDAVSVLPYAKSPESSVPATSSPNVWLRVITAGNRHWLVAEAASGTPPGAEILRSEAIQRSGCLVSGVTSVAASTVFLLDCT